MELIGFTISSKQTLLQMLFKGETDRFIDELAAPLEALAKLTPTLDAMFLKGKGRPT